MKALLWADAKDIDEELLNSLVDLCRRKYEESYSGLSAPPYFRFKIPSNKIKNLMLSMWQTKGKNSYLFHDGNYSYEIDELLIALPEELRNLLIYNLDLFWTANDR